MIISVLGSREQISGLYQQKFIFHLCGCHSDMNISTVLFDLPLNKLAKRKVTVVSMQDQKEVILSSPGNCLFNNQHQYDP